jgi:hypothetical protein
VPTLASRFALDVCVGRLNTVVACRAVFARATPSGRLFPNSQVASPLCVCLRRQRACVRQCHRMRLQHSKWFAVTQLTHATSRHCLRSPCPHPPTPVPRCCSFRHSTRFHWTLLSLDRWCASGAWFRYANLSFKVAPSHASHARTRTHTHTHTHTHAHAHEHARRSSTVSLARARSPVCSHTLSHTHARAHVRVRAGHV